MRRRRALPGKAFLLTLLLHLGLQPALAQECTAGDETSRLRCQLDAARALVRSLTSVIADKDAELERKEALIKEKDAELARKEAVVKEKGVELAPKEAVVEERDIEPEQKDAVVDEKDIELAQKEAAVKEKDVALARKEAALKERDLELARKEAALEERDAELAPREAAVGWKDIDLEQKEAPIKEKDVEFGQKEAAVKLKNIEPEQKEAAVKEKDAELEQTEAAIEAKDLELAQREAALEENGRREALDKDAMRQDAWLAARARSTKASKRPPRASARTVWTEEHQYPNRWRRRHLGSHVVERERYQYLVEKGRHGRLLEDRADLPTFIAALPANTTEISFPFGGLAGTLPADLGRLIHLEYLDMSYNYIVGTLPAELGRLVHLKYLDLSFCFLTGTIPADLGKLAELTYLSLGSNKLTGPVPAEMGNLAQLSAMALYGNELTGTLPAELGNLAQLTMLQLTGNQLTGTIPPDLGKLAKLIILDMDANSLTGTVPAELGKLAQLTELALGANHITGTIPPDLGNLTQLNLLSLYGNRLAGTVPPELGDLGQLASLQLNDNSLTGAIPRELGSLTQLTTLGLYANGLTGAVPPELSNLRQLPSLDLHANSLSGPIPPELGELAQLTALDLSSNSLAGTIPPELGKLARLTALDLSSNSLTGTIPPELGKLTQLTALDLNSNLLTGALPDELGLLAPLKTLTLAGNRFSGTLPAVITRLQALQLLDVSDNLDLTGTFPDTTSSKLVTIRAANCSFRSAGAVGGSVKTLAFAHNNFTELPAAWVNLPAVLSLDLSDNHIVWRPYGVLLSYDFESTSASYCNMKPSVPSLRWPVIQALRLSGNPLGLNILPNPFILSLSYLTSLSELFAANCHLEGRLVPEQSDFLGVEVKDTSNCTSFPDVSAGFQGLLTLDLSDNGIDRITAAPPPRLSTADLHSNSLSTLAPGWYKTPSTLEVWNNPLLKAEVRPPVRESGCSTAGAPVLEADPFGFVTKPGDAFQCTSLCPGVKTRYKHDASLNASSLCRCAAGGQGDGTDCAGCPADTYSDPVDRWAMVRICRPCPDASSTGLAENATGVGQCRCPAGWYMETPAAGVANATAAPACKRCRQGRFMDTRPGATQEAQCTCNASYDGLRSMLGICGCADGQYMDNLALACSRCDAVAEECAWGSAIELSLLPPVVRPAYWAAPPPEGGVDEASNFSRHDIWRCFSKDTCLGNSVCADGRFGTACSLCAEGMYGGPDGPCKPCPYNPEVSRKTLAYGLLIGPGATIAAHTLLSAQGGASRRLALTLASLRTSGKQSLKYLQMLGVIAGFNIHWPPLARQLFAEVSRVTIALPQVSGVACLAGQQTATLEMGFRWLIPVAGVVSACLSALVLAPLRAFGGRSRYCKLAHMSKWDVLRVSLWGLALFYSTLLQFGTQVLACMPGPNGVRTVVTFPHLRCGDGGEWAQLAAISVAFLLLFVAAVFLGVYAAWRRATHTLVESRFKSKGWWGFLFDDYRDGWGHWLMVTMIKDAALVVIATAAASDGPSQLLATAVVSTLYSYVVLRDQPFQDASNNILEAWTMMSVALLSVFSAGMGFQSAPGVADVVALFPDGATDPEYKKRERVLLAAQCFTFVGPAGIMLYQLLLLCLTEKVRNRLPAFLRAPTDEERAKWNKDFLRSLKLDEATAGELWGVMDRLDVVDNAKFRDLMSTSTATLGTLPSSDHGLNLKHLVRKRFAAEVARSAEFNKAAHGDTRGVVTLTVVAEADERSVVPEGNNNKQVCLSEMLRADKSTGEVVTL